MNAAYPAIQAAYPTCIIIRASVRKTPTKALAHITTLETLFWSNLTIATSSQITADAHYYVSTDPTVQTTDTPSVTTEASPILSIAASNGFNNVPLLFGEYGYLQWDDGGGDRKSTRLNSSHQIISYAVFCLKKKKQEIS